MGQSALPLSWALSGPWLLVLLITTPHAAAECRGLSEWFRLTSVTTAEGKTQKLPEYQEIVGIGTTNKQDVRLGSYNGYYEYGWLEARQNQKDAAASSVSSAVTGQARTGNDVQVIYMGKASQASCDGLRDRYNSHKLRDTKFEPKTVDNAMTKWLKERETAAAAASTLSTEGADSGDQVQDKKGCMYYRVNPCADRPPDVYTDAHRMEATQLVVHQRKTNSRPLLNAIGSAARPDDAYANGDSKNSGWPCQAPAAGHCQGITCQLNGDQCTSLNLQLPQCDNVNPVPQFDFVDCVVDDNAIITKPRNAQGEGSSKFSLLTTSAAANGASSRNAQVSAPLRQRATGQTAGQVQQQQAGNLAPQRRPAERQS